MNMMTGLNSFRHIPRATQFEHGERVEERQRVNGQPNGYRAISEAELRKAREGKYGSEATAYKPAHGGYCA